MKAKPDEANPYAASNLDATSVKADDPRSIAKKRLSRPATALIVMASIQSVLCAISLVSIAVAWSRGSLPLMNLSLVALSCLQFVSLIMIAVGAAKMGFLESRKMGRIAAVLACIPYFTPFMIVGIPFGIWSLKLLNDPEIAAAFDSARHEKHLDPMRSGDAVA